MSFPLTPPLTRGAAAISCRAIQASAASGATIVLAPTAGELGDRGEGTKECHSLRRDERPP